MRLASRLLLAAAGCAACISGIAAGAGAQVRPDADWRTIRTAHFYVHFTPALEVVARRTAADAETAYAQLAGHLHRPRGPIDIVVSDDVDFSNGFATTYPTNRIVLYANPPVFETALRFTDDPMQLVVTHELTHIFHLDRSRGIWRALQFVFGRAPFLFPNAFQPSWLVEGLAVYYESELTGSGRLAGSEHRMIARTAALAHELPRIDQLSLSTPRYPYGYTVYAYGSLFMDYLGRTRGDSSMRRFVEAGSSQLIPFYLDGAAKRAFGESFGAAYRDWTRTLLDSAPPWIPPMPGWRALTTAGAFASFPRWLDDSTVVYTGTDARQSFGAYTLALQRDGSVVRRRLGRRDSDAPNAVTNDGSLLYSQLEYVSPYEIRSDLYISRPSGGTRQITRGARLAFPDARSDGRIVAVQTLPGGTRIALVSADGVRVHPITGGGPDEQWSDPRWSPDGRKIAAVRWTRGGTSSVVVIDTAGRIERTLVMERAVDASPSWSADGRYLYFASDRSGITNLYRVDLAETVAGADSTPGLQQVSDARTGLFQPQPSRDDRDLAAVVFQADGYHVGIAPIDSIRQAVAPTLQAVDPREFEPAASDTSPMTRYSAWRTLMPRYWIPLGESALESGAARLGALISGQDVIGRHSYQALLLVPTDNSGLAGSLYYRNAMAGQPIVEMATSQDWENRGCISDQQGTCVGTLRRRIREATLALTAQRPRMRTFSYVSVGAGYEVRDYASNPQPLLEQLDPVFGGVYFYPRATISAGWSNTQRPTLAISPEDGVALAGTARYRWRTGDSESLTSSFVGSALAFKSLDLPGFAHHVVALRVAGGSQDNRGTGYYEVGGVSGGVLDVVPGYALGEGRRTFGVRGFPAASLLGIRAYTASAEYRAPLALPGRGLGTLPLFFDRSSLTLFGDAGSAWCPGTFDQRPAPSPSLCTAPDIDGGFVFTQPHVIASAGAELNISAAILNWDAPFVYRLGFAAPVMGTEFVAGANKPAGYFTVGVSF